MELSFVICLKNIMQTFTTINSCLSHVNIAVCCFNSGVFNSAETTVLFKELVYHYILMVNDSSMYSSLTSICLGKKVTLVIMKLQSEIGKLLCIFEVFCVHLLQLSNVCCALDFICSEYSSKPIFLSSTVVFLFSLFASW